MSEVPEAVAAAWEPAPRGWYPAVAAGVFPALLLGFVASALANRLAFVGWGAVAALGHALLLRASWRRGWTVAARAGLLLGWGALALLSFATLVQRHGEILDLGYRAVLWPVYTPTLTSAATFRLAAGGLAVAALVVGLVTAARRRRETTP